MKQILSLCAVFALAISGFAATPVISGTAPRRVQATFPRGANHTITAIGDSFTENYLYTFPYEFYPEVLAGHLRNLGCTVKARNFGVSGDTSPGMVARAEALTRFETPDIGIIYAGANDPASPMNTAGTQLHIQALIKCFKFGAINAVTNPAALPAGKLPGTRYVTMLDADATGGVAAYGSLKATITGAGGSVQTVWECRNANAGVTGWGRVAVAATAPTHTSKIIVVGMHLLNYTPSGETPSSQIAAWNDSTGLRSAQIAAVAAENVGGATVVYNNTYSFMGALITSGQEAQNSFSWHVATGNTHLNVLGEQYVAQSILATIQAQTGWIAALK